MLWCGSLTLAAKVVPQMLRVALYDRRPASVSIAGPKVPRILQRNPSQASVNGLAASVAPEGDEVPSKITSYVKRPAPMEAFLRG